MKAKRIITYIVAGIVVAAAVVAGVLYTKGFFGSSTASSSTSYTVDKLTTGDISKSVTGTGTLAAADSTAIDAPLDVTIDTVVAQAGQNVKKGDKIATVNQDDLASTIETLQTDINSLDSSITKRAASEATAKYLTSTVSGRVKQILCASGDDANADTQKNGGLIVLSTDGKMTLSVQLSKANATAVGKSVKVVTGGHNYSGLVEALSSDGMTAAVTLTDDGPKLGASAKVYTTGGTLLGSGKLAVNRPCYVTAAAGTVADLYVEVNDSISTRTKLAYLTGIPYSDTYNDLVKSRDEYAAELKTAQDLQSAGCIAAPSDGTLKSLTVSAGNSVKEGDSIGTLLLQDNFVLDVSVDELDINSVSVGQDASIAVDAVSDKTFDGAVQSISQIGSASNGVTTYTVAIQMAADPSLKVGMNATATIVIEKHSGVLLMPIEALNTVQGKSYVWLYTGTLPTDSSQDPGTRTEVTTGLSNDNYVEVTSGLTAADQVVVVRTKSTTGTTSSSNSNSLFGGMGGMTSGNMPSGGQGGFPGGGPGGN